MKFLIKLFLVSFICMIAMFGALGSDNQWSGLIVAFAVWGWFIYSLSKPKETATDRKSEHRSERLRNCCGNWNKEVKELPFDGANLSFQ